MAHLTATQGLARAPTVPREERHGAPDAHGTL